MYLQKINNKIIKMGQEKGTNQRAGVTNRDLGTTYLSGATTASTAAQVRRAAITQSNAIAAKYTNNTTKAGWVANVSPKQK
jgi:hypothetical protein